MLPPTSPGTTPGTRTRRPTHRDAPLRSRDPGRPRTGAGIPAGGRGAEVVPALRALHRWGGVAMTPAALRERAGREGGSTVGTVPELVERLEDREDLFQVLAPRRRRWAGAAPRSWILARTPPPTPETAPPLLARARRALRLLASRVNAESTREMARWERYLLEEERLARQLERRERRRQRRGFR